MLIQYNQLKGEYTMKHLLSVFILTLASLLILCSCSPSSLSDHYYNSGISESDSGFSPNYQYDSISENDFVSTAEETSSYFSLDRNTASYSLMRREINQGLTTNANSVRLEEYVNYFNYNYARPSGEDALALSGSVFDCPWNEENKLFTIGIAAEEISFASDIQNNIIFLIDISGSMFGEDRLGLIQQAFTMLLDNLGDNDYVSIVTYASNCRVALSGARGTEKTKIANVLQDLSASGTTNGSGGIQLAYAEAEKYFIQGGNNRVILATDGDFNVGISDKNQLKNFISEKRQSGIYLTVLGVGMFNTNDSTMKTLAESGNGNYAYLDSVAEARKVLVEELNGTFNVVAKDAKAGVIFNPETVEKYRLIGYESKMISQDEFYDENKDAGEIGSGHTVTAVYEIKIKDNAAGNIATVEIKYKHPESNENKNITETFTTYDYSANPDEDCIFIGCVVEYGLLLRNSEFKGNADFENVISRLSQLSCVREDPFKAEFLEIVKKACILYS